MGTANLPYLVPERFQLPLVLRIELLVRCRFDENPVLEFSPTKEQAPLNMRILRDDKLERRRVRLFESGQ